MKHFGEKINNFISSFVKSKEFNFGLVTLIVISIIILTIFIVYFIGFIFEKIVDYHDDLWPWYTFGRGTLLFLTLISYICIEISFFRVMSMTWTDLNKINPLDQNECDDVAENDTNCTTFMICQSGIMFASAFYGFSWLFFYGPGGSEKTLQCFHFLLFEGIYIASRTISILFLPCFLSMIFHFRSSFCIDSKV